jgi:superfamily II DNA or RNA helicase
MRITVTNLVCQINLTYEDNKLGIDFTKELRDYLRVKVAGANYSPAYRNRTWDGYQYFVTKNLTFMVGHLEYIIKFLQKLSSDIVIEVVDMRSAGIVWKPELIKELPNGWKLLEPQERAMRAIRSKVIKLPDGSELPFSRGIIDVATNGGKNTIMASIAQNMEELNMLIVVDRVKIQAQIYDFFIDLFGKENVGQITSKHFVLKAVTVISFQSLKSKIKKGLSMNETVALKNYKCLAIDECHRAGGSGYADLIRYINAPNVFFLSGTPLDVDDPVMKVTITSLSGHTLIKINNDELIALGISQKPIVTIHSVSGLKSKDYKTECSYLYNCPNRAAKILEIILANSGKTILVTFKEQVQGDYIHNYLKLRGVENAVTSSYDSKSEQKIIDFKEGRIKVLVCSMIIREGLNIPNIRVLIAAQAGKDKVTVKQLVGRVVRLDVENTDVAIHDFYDDYGKYSIEHSKKRLLHYKVEGFDIIYDYANKNGKPLLQL